MLEKSLDGLIRPRVELISAGDPFIPDLFFVSVVNFSHDFMLDSVNEVHRVVHAFLVVF